MPYFREEDNKRKQNSWSDEAHSVLVLAIQTIDKLGGREEFPDLRQRLDLILNSEHWKEKRSKEDKCKEKLEEKRIDEGGWRS
tara:strand:+ start:216 stop:464 length:249 start_codon:yes stop_codon:yes gene_type:complete